MLRFPLLLLLLFQKTIAQNLPDSFSTLTIPVPGTSYLFRMVPVPEGTFYWGSPELEKGRKKDEGPQKKVSISAFWMGEHEVTYDEFLVYFEDETIARNAEADAVTRPTPQYIDLSWGMGKQGGYPVNSMSHYTALMYCKWLYEKTGVFYRLPTEAEWEYACRAGTVSAYYFGEDEKKLKEYAWFEANSKKKYQKVMQKKPNAWGLYDMMGNVSEWTLDQYEETFRESLSETVKDPCNAPTKRYPRSVKGGSFMDTGSALRCAARGKSEAAWNKRDPQIPKSKWWLTDGMAVGFRLVRPLQQPSKSEIEAFYQKFLGN